MFVSQFCEGIAKVLMCSCIALAAISVATADEAASPAATGSDSASMDRRSAPEPADPELLEALAKATPIEMPDVSDQHIKRRGEMDAKDWLSGMGTVSKRTSGEVETAPVADSVEQAIRQRAESPLPVPKPQRPEQPLRGGVDGGAEGESPDSSQVRERRVHGPDDRVRIHDTRPYPFRAFGQILIEYPHKWSTCSATLISPSHLLTAAHCVFDIKTQVWSKQIWFYPGRNGKTGPYGHYAAARWFIPTGFLEQPGTDYSADYMSYDIAIIRLSNNAGDRLGWLSYGHDEDLSPFVANIVGYPADKPSGTLWRSSCDVDPSSGPPHLFVYFCDTHGGASGAAMYDYEDSTQGRLILGVHIAGSAGGNKSLRITKPWYEWIQKSTQ